jgi:hypothetical protein
METMNDLPSTWRSIKSLDDAKQLVDFGILLSWKDMRHVRKVLQDQELEDLVRYFALRLAERVENRLPEEILIESVLIIMANTADEEILNAFLEELLQQPNRLEACFTLVELAITAEISDVDHFDDIFSFAVALICELGNLIQEIEKAHPGELGDKSYKLLDHISTYLLSVSNSNNNCIRLSLVQYFGAQEQGNTHKPGFNRIMGRFGHTVLEHLFTLLFNKKTEGVALQFLLENIPYILEADNHSQRILHETWKYYMLKRPERFALFIQTLTNHIASLPEDQTKISRKVFMQHLGILLKIVSEVNHRDLGREIMCSIATFNNDPYRNELIQALVKEKGIRENFRKFLIKLGESSNTEQVIDQFDSFRSSKRGRKPSFAKADKTRPIYQVTFLGHQAPARAS